MPKERPTQERVRELLDYDPETGFFIRRKASRSGPKGRKYGQIGAGRVSELGYVLIMIDGTNYIAGSLAWLHVNGSWPQGRIKYINGNPLDNRIDNIRVQDQSRGEMSSRKLTAERLKELAVYDPETGFFSWRITSAVAKPGLRMGTIHGNGYCQIGIDYRKYLAHQLAWLYMTGEWVGTEIDHINGVRSDNRWSNLRASTRSQNNHNRTLSRKSEAGFPGVRVHGRKFTSRLQFEGQEISRGWYKTIAEARIARLLAEKQYFGRFMTWVEERDGILPLGDGFISILVRDNCLYVLDAQGSPIEVTNVNDIEVLPITEDGHVIQ